MSFILLFIINIIISIFNIGIYEIGLANKSANWLVFIINLTLFFAMIAIGAARNFKKFFTLFLLIFGHIFALVSCALGEYFEEYLVEVNTIAYFKGASLWLILYCILYIGMAYISFNKLYIEEPKVFRIVENSKIIEFIMPSISIISILCMAFCLLVYGSPLFANIVRFDYWINVPWIFKKIYIVLLVLPLYFGITFNNNKLRNMLLFIACIIISVLVGDKFSGLFSMFFLFAYGYLISEGYEFTFSFKSTIKALVIFTVITSLLFNIIIYHYNNFSGGFAGNIGAQAIFYRILGQGQVEYYFLSQENFHIYDFIYEITNWFTLFPDSLNLGMYKLMGVIGSDVHAAAERSIRLSMAFPAIIVYYVGAIGAIPIVILIGYFIGKIYYRFYIEVKCKNIINSIIAYRIIMLSFEAFGMGNLHRFFSIECLIYFAIYYINCNYTFVSRKYK